MDNLKRALKEATKDEKIAIIAHIIDEDPDILEELEAEGFIKDTGKWLGHKTKEYGPGILKAVGKAGLKTLEKTGEVATGAIAGAVKGAVKGAIK